MYLYLARVTSLWASTKIWGGPQNSSDTITEDYSVKTEFGVDAWTYLIKAGFSNVSMHVVEYPAGIAYLAIK